MFQVVVQSPYILNMKTADYKIHTHWNLDGNSAGSQYYEQSSGCALLRFMGQSVGNDGTDAGYCGTLILINPSNADHHKVLRTDVFGLDSNYNVSWRSGAGSWDGSYAAVQALNMNCSTGNFKGGTVKVYGVL